MPDYKHRWIELSPRQDTHDGMWRCHYMIIEFRHMSWRYRQGYPDGVFASRDAAASVALEEAQRLVDAGVDQMASVGTGEQQGRREYAEDGS
ncbi:MAG: hypothetical protein NDI90_01210 [Nitrospira sp. BO4]|nr:hypothetical protein [Nitrospira sp. BO4]